MNEKDIAAMKEVAEEMKRNTQHGEAHKMSFISVRTECARAALRYVEHLESVGAHTKRESREKVAANKAAAVDLTSLTRYGWAEITSVGVFDIMPRADGTYVSFSEVAALFASAVPAESAKPVARLQEEVSDRPFTEGQKFFDVVILDRERCTDGMLLYTRAAPAALPDEQPRAEQVLRRLLAYRVAGATLYADDGQLHDASAKPWIDFKNDSVDTIEAKLIERTKTALSAAPTASQPAEQPDLIREALAVSNAIMNIACRRKDDSFLNEASRLLYKEGHRDARHDAADLVLERADQIAALATTTSQPDEARDAALEEFWGVYRTESDGSGDWLRDGPHIAQYSLGNAKRLCISPEYAPRRLLLVDGESALAPTAASPSHPDAELRRAVKAMALALASREWAEHVSSDPDAAALESEITRLVGLASPSHPDPEKQQGWISVGERLPVAIEAGDDSDYACSPGDSVVCAIWRGEHLQAWAKQRYCTDGHWRQGDSLGFVPTHWKPVPSAPGSSHPVQQQEQGNERKTLSKYADPDNWTEDERGIKRVWMEPDSSSPMEYDGFTLARAALAQKGK